MVLGTHVPPGPAVVFALGLREGDLAGVAVPQLDPGLQDLPWVGLWFLIVETNLRRMDNLWFNK